MSQDQNRHGRKQTSDRRCRRRLRAALALLAIALAGFGAIPLAQAETGGASGYEAAAPSGEALAFGPLRYAGASWYGPGLWGRSTACGVTLRPTTIGVAHKRLPCGTMVRFVYEGHTITAPVIDRGPYVKGRAWDLTAAASEAIGFESAGVGRVGYQVAVEYARH
ncbi:MAG: septal ring lytic transglycosylase RlpA family protein [Solirubrobacterales bacterium]